MNVRFKKKYFNPLYFILDDLAKDNNIRTILVYGGKSSAKTVSITQFIMKELVVKNASSIAFRKESAIIQTTLKKSFNLARSTTFLTPAVETLSFSYRNKFSSAEIVLKGLDDEEKAKGIESYKYVFLDELNHFEHGEYIQFQMSLRGIIGQKIFAAWNPVDETSWVKTDLIDKEIWIDTEYKLPCKHSFVKISSDGKTVLIKTTYEDNYWIVGNDNYGFKDENLISQYEKLKTTDFNRYMVNVLGEWGKVSVGGEAYKFFNTEKNTLCVNYNPELPLHLSFDFNLRPGMHATIFQIENKTIYQIAEIITKSPKNSTKYACEDFKTMFRGHSGGLFIYGDPSGRNGSTRQEEGHNDYTIVLNELKGYRPSLRVAFSHPSPKMRIEFINEIFLNGFQGIEMYIGINCLKTIEDLLYIKEDENGGKVKEKFKDSNTGMSYEKYGHLTDSLDYFICEAFKNEYKKFQNPNIGVLPPIYKVPSKPKCTL